MSQRQTARQAAQETFFQNACKRAGIKPTARQASKWRRGKGLALANAKANILAIVHFAIDRD